MCTCVVDYRQVNSAITLHYNTSDDVMINDYVIMISLSVVKEIHRGVWSKGLDLFPD